MCGWDRIVVRQAHRAQAAILKGRAARVQNCHLYTRPWKAMPTVKKICEDIPPQLHLARAL